MYESLVANRVIIINTRLFTMILFTLFHSYRYCVHSQRRRPAVRLSSSVTTRHRRGSRRSRKFYWIQSLEAGSESSSLMSACSLAEHLQRNATVAASMAIGAPAATDGVAEIRLFWWHRFRGSRRAHLAPETQHCGRALRCVSDSRAEAFASTHGVVVWVGSRPQAHCLPPRLLSHTWLLEYSESPGYYPELHSALFTRQFDLKVSYELDSDVIMTALHPMVEGGTIPPAEWLREPAARSRPAAIVYVASNCASRNEREQLVRRLQAALPPTLPLHSVGKCLHTHEAPELAPQPATGRPRDGTTWRSKARALSAYAFCLVAENSIARDYVTEKLFHAFAAGCVPVYYGARSVERLLPHPKAIVRVLAFSNLEELVRHLVEMVANVSMYREHLAWRDDGPLVQRWWQRMQALTGAARTATKPALFCELCRVVQRARMAAAAAGGVRVRELAPSPRPKHAVWPPLEEGRGLISWLRTGWRLEPRTRGSRFRRPPEL